MKVLTSEQMREIDRLTSDQTGVPSLILMENAAFNLFLALQDRFEDLAAEEILILCGKGNNGGDGMALARQLLQRGIYPDLVLLSKRESISRDAAVNLEILTRSGFPVFEIPDLESWSEFSSNLDRYTVIVDALLGTGITQPLSGFYAEVVQDLNQADAFVLAVDIPSGLISDSPTVDGPLVWADATVTFTAPKLAHVLSHNIEAIGALSVVPIGTPPSLLDRPEFRIEVLEETRVAEYLPARPASSHKGTYGHAVIIGGSRGKSGAAALGAQAALRSGAGLVTAASPISAQALIAGSRPEVMTEAFAETEKGAFAAAAVDAVLEFLRDKSAAGIGPGITTRPEAREFIRNVVEHSPVPLVIDADGLNAFEGCVDRLKNQSGLPLVLTPHPGEFSRLCGSPAKAILEDPLPAATRFSADHGVWLILKMFRNIIALPDGSVFISPRGNPGMATAGMGDVLTGILTGVLAQHLAAGVADAGTVTRAVCLGVYLHGLAADLAAEKKGWESLIAGDLFEALPEAFARLRSQG